MLNRHFALALVLSAAPAVLLAQSRYTDIPPQPRLNRVVEMFEKGIPPIGSFFNTVTARAAANHATSGLDFVMIDMEHSVYDITRLQEYLLGMVNKRRILAKGNLQPDVMPMVRLPSNGREHVQYMIKQVLDIGMFGVLMPHINTREDALWAVRSMRYPQRLGVPDMEPRGQRGVGYGWAARYWGMIDNEYTDRADLWPLDPKGDLLLWLMIESSEAVANINEIVRVPGVGGVFVGPGDLSFSLGVNEEDPRVEEATQKVLAAAKQAGVPCGTMADSRTVGKRLEQGFRFLMVSADGGVSSAAGQAIQERDKHIKK
jgi:4-hydroxy-2-oxoheptanedioate aldolase